MNCIDTDVYCNNNNNNNNNSNSNSNNNNNRYHDGDTRNILKKDSTIITNTNTTNSCRCSSISSNRKTSSSSTNSSSSSSYYYYSSNSSNKNSNNNSSIYIQRIPFVAFFIFMLFIFYSMPMVSCHTTTKTDIHNQNNDNFQHQLHHQDQQQQQQQQQQNFLTAEYDKNVLLENEENNNNKIHLTRQNFKRKKSHNLQQQQQNGVQEVEEGGEKGHYQQQQYLTILNEWWSPLNDTTNNDTQSKKSKGGKFRKRFKNKGKQNIKSEKYQNHDQYDVMKASNNNSSEIYKYIESDKKYFDYFPIEKVESISNETSIQEDIDRNIKVVFLLNNNNNNNNKEDTLDNSKNNKRNGHHHQEQHHHHHNNKRHNQNRKKFKKHLSQNNSNDEFIDADNHKSRSDVNLHTSFNRKKRNTDDGSKIVLSSVNVDNIESKENLIRKRRVPLQLDENGQYYSQGTSYDPWNNRFLTQSTGYRYPVGISYSPSRPVVKYPIPGIYYNPISPPGNYQPPRRPSTAPAPSDGTIEFGDRIGGDDEDNNDRVIWDIVYSTGGGKQPYRTTPAAARQPRPPPSTTTTTTQRPQSLPTTTRRRRPLIHPPIKDDGTENNRVDTTTRRRPSLIHPPITESPSSASNQDRNIFSGNSLNSEIRTTQRPLETTTRRTGPSQCVWAIINCCSRGSLAIRYACFEQIGCHGSFWDNNPCAEDIQDAALEVGDDFYNKGTRNF